MTPLLSCREIAKSFGGRPLFRGISFGILPGERIGLVGPNGSGKSTLLNILSGVEPSDEGAVSRRRDLTIAFANQEDAVPEGASVLEALATSLASKPLEDFQRIALVSKMAAAMGFTDQPVASLSGGWRKRLSIASALIQEPDILILDEPTNHLDIEGVLQLETLLAALPGALLVVSHDRYFLERVTNRTIELNRVYADGYLSVQGPYSELLARREELTAIAAHQQHALQGRVRKEIEWLRRGPQARTTKAQARIDQAHRMIDDLADLKTRNASGGGPDIAFTKSDRRTRDLVTIKGARKSLGGRVVLSEVDLSLARGVRLGLIGPNGSGKTTLVRMITGALEPDEGTVQRADRLRVVLFQQSRDDLDRSLSLRRALAADSDVVDFRGSTMHVTAWAKRFQFREEQLEMRVEQLSGGEQARVLIANLMRKEADVLILDEPTNDLDIPALEVLEDSLTEFAGALVLVTHDRYLLDHVATEVLALDGAGNCTALSDYAQWEQLKRESTAPLPVRAAEQSQRTTAGRRRMTTAERRELDSMEAAILTAEQHAKELESKLSDPAVAADYVAGRAVLEQYDAAKDRVAKLYNRWSELEDIV